MPSNYAVLLDIKGQSRQLQGKSYRGLQKLESIHIQLVSNKLKTASATNTPPIADSPGLRGSSPVLGPHLNGSTLPIVNGKISRMKPPGHSEKFPAKDTAEETPNTVTAGSPKRYVKLCASLHRILVIFSEEWILILLDGRNDDISLLLSIIA